MRRPSQPDQASQQQHRTELRKRKIRKGTQSCWECKRRKVCCKFTNATEQVCDGCKRRKTTCISQEFPDITANVRNNQQWYQRLAQLEEVVGQLVKNVDGSDISRNNDQSPPPAAQDLRIETCVSLDASNDPSTTGKIIVQLDDHLSHLADQVKYVSDHHQRDEVSSTQIAPSNPSLITTAFSTQPESSSVDYESLSQRLLQAWPTERDLKKILDLHGETSGLFHGTILAPFSTSLYQKTSSIQDTLQLPATGSHPVLLARKLLILATYLQCLSPACMRQLEIANVDHRTLMSSAVETVHTYLTFNDEFLGSIEGIECVMIESMYENNNGNLRSAWHYVHRAMLIAQMMGLHRRNTTPASLNFLEADTRTRVLPDYMWFRLIQMNRYLSLMLGMLQGTPCNNFADAHVLEECTPVERMQRMDVVAAGYILQRNEAGVCDTSTTNMIDQLLQKSEATVPTSYWLVPDFEVDSGEEMSTLEKILQTVDQLSHYHLVTQLHLPHLLRSNLDHQHDYSKTMAVNASREVLKRYTMLHGVHAFTSFCRGVNFLAFIACTTLCIVHMDARRQRPGYSNDGPEIAGGAGAFLDLLTPQHQRDRNLMELTLKSMENMSNQSGDKIASRTAVTLRHLLFIEADTSQGGNYVADQPFPEVDSGFGCGGKVSACGRVLHIHIPNIGTIRFEQGGARQQPYLPQSTLATDQRHFLNYEGQETAQIFDPVQGMVSILDL